MATVDDQKLIDRLNAKHADAIRFSLATWAVVRGYKLEPVSGGSVSVSQVGTYDADLADLMTGKTIAAGATEQYKHGSVRCYRKQGRLFVAVFAGERLRSRTLPCRFHDEDEVDEGLFTWFGPVEYVGTAWSDNDPDQCQVITIDHLRAFADLKR